MGLFKIDLKGSVEHNLRRLDKQFIPKLVEVIGTLSVNPFPVQSKKMRGSEASYRLKVGDYRMIYQVDNESKIVTVYHVRHRKDIYRK